MAWFTTDLETIEEFLGWGSIMLVDAGFQSVLVLYKMFSLDWVLTLIALIPMLLIILWGGLVEKFMALKWKIVRSNLIIYMIMPKNHLLVLEL